MGSGKCYEENKEHYPRMTEGEDGGKGSSRKEDQKGFSETVALIRDQKDKEPALQRPGAKILPCGGNSKCKGSRVT